MPPTSRIVVTDDDLTEHRLKVLEALSAGAHETERRVDHLTLDVTAIKEAVVRIEASMGAEARRAHDSNRRMHERLDEWDKREAEREGASKERRRLLKLAGGLLAAVGVIAAVTFGVLQAVGVG